jgi:hypothetical protein
MTGLLTVLPPALLAAALTQPPPLSAPPCLPPEAHVGEISVRYFCGALSAAAKGRLEGPTAYRLVYLPSFRPGKIVEVRQERAGWLIQTTILSGIGGAPGGIQERRQRWLTADDVLDLAATVDRSGVRRPDTRVRSNAVDDSLVLVEAVQPGQHRVHLVFARALGEESFRDLVELLRAMAGIDDLEK